MKKDNFKITTIHAFVAVGEDGDEGICGVKLQDTWMPMVCADKARIDSLMPVAQNLKKTGQKVRLVKFTKTEDIEI